MKLTLKIDGVTRTINDTRDTTEAALDISTIVNHLEDMLKSEFPVSMQDRTLVLREEPVRNNRMFPNRFNGSYAETAQNISTSIRSPYDFSAVNEGTASADPEVSFNPTPARSG